MESEHSTLQSDQNTQQKNKIQTVEGEWRTNLFRIIIKGASCVCHSLTSHEMGFSMWEVYFPPSKRLYFRHPLTTNYFSICTFIATKSVHTLH